MMATVLYLLSLLAIYHHLCRAVSPPAHTQPGTITGCSQWYIVKQGDTCSTVEQQHGISHRDFLRWNAAISEDCSQNFWVNYAYCVGVQPGKTASGADSLQTSASSAYTSAKGYNSAFSSVYLATATSGRYSAGNSTGFGVNATGTGTSAGYSIRNSIKTWNISTPTIDMSWPPKQTQAGQPSHCNKWYLVSATDSCADISAKNSVSNDELIEWNPALGSDCTGLKYNYFVCISIQPQTSMTFRYFSDIGNITIPPYTLYKPTQFPKVNSSFTATPTQSGLVSGCRAFHQAATGETCNSVLNEFGYISEQEFFQWNPALQSNCDSLKPHYWYCVAYFSAGDLPMPPTATQAPSPVPSGVPKDCRAWYQTHLPDDCETIAMMFGTFSKSDFLKWNPSVWDDCSNIKDETWYCVAVADTPKTRIHPLPSTLPVQNQTISITSAPTP